MQLYHKETDKYSSKQAYSVFNLGPFDGIGQVYYNTINQRLQILQNGFLSETHGPPGAKFMIKISDVIDTVIDTVIYKYSDNIESLVFNIESLVFENVQLRRSQNVELFMVDSSNNIVSGVGSYDITAKLREACFVGYKPSVIGISQDNKRITLSVTKRLRDNL